MAHFQVLIEFPMGRKFREWQPVAGWLFPPSPRDWLPEDHLVYSLLDVTDQIDVPLYFVKNHMFLHKTLAAISRRLTPAVPVHHDATQPRSGDSIRLLPPLRGSVRGLSVC